MWTSKIMDAIVLHQNDIIKQEFNAAKEECDDKEYAEIAIISSIMPIACRFGGADTIQVLIDCGADLSSRGYWNYATSLLDNSPWTGKFSYVHHKNWYRCLTMSDKVFTTLPKEKRLESLELLLRHPEFDICTDELLYESIINRDKETTDILRSHGITFTDDIKNSLFKDKSSYLRNKLFNILEFDDDIYFEKFLDIVEDILKESDGGKIKIPNEIVYANTIMFNPTNLDRTIRCFDFANVNKLQYMKDHYAIKMFPIYERLGWLKHRPTRDAMIKFSTEKNNTELTAWLLDFKNRTADFEKERKNAEYRENRELTAAPDSVYMMKKIWSYRKYEDGIEITSYKKQQENIVIPDKIGRQTVVSIGRNMLRRKKESELNLIKSVTIPDTIRKIDGGTFQYLVGLERLRLPDNLESIGSFAFNCCSGLKEITVPSGVKVIPEHSFSECDSLEKLVLKEGLEEIKRCAFYNCEKLSEAAIPGSVKKYMRTGISRENGTHGLSRLACPRILCQKEPTAQNNRLRLKGLKAHGKKGNFTSDFDESGKTHSRPPRIHDLHGHGSG